MKRRILLFLGISFLVACLYTYLSPFVLADNEETRIVYAEKLYLREGPGLSYSILDTLQKNDKLKVLDAEGDWLYVETDGKKGWVASWLTQKIHKENVKKFAVVQVDHLNIRLEPSLDAPVLGQLFSGDQVAVQNERDQWVQIRHQQITGWVSKEYVSINEAKTDESKDDEGKELESAESDDANYFTIAVNAVNVRNKPNLKSKELGIAKKGEQYRVLDRHNHWIQIDYHGKKGWIYSFYGSFEFKRNKEEKKKKTVTIIYNGTNIRKEPSTSSNVLSIARAGEQYRVIGTDGDWYKIQLPDKSAGFVASWVVSTDGQSQSPKKKGKRKKGTLNGVTIVIDPGHGGNDQGTAGLRNTIEKEITLKTAELLKSKLQQAGANVYLTRESDVYVALQKRVSLAHQHGADAFVSIHYDASEDRTVSGFTTYYFHSYQESLAQYVHDGLTKQVDLRDRGIQKGNYLVLRENKQNAVLIELGYLSNPREEKTIDTDLFREKATMGIYEGLLKYFDAQL
ncbi:SH3 domain-containing protein [Ureibacillus sp. FSL K6-8385]|uniref:SH3 domain-containing protein n=1 Tax=Ureibacillus terrenus TaxID=118246 RepID=A0A540V545_9BACL|nr:SH3 domain-containing protein [Ureibacillus terrenus]MED3662649.1 N-acetylmuramoyl-L-alanine amidase [Ureibacillus terrenus]MED3764899.1 N-acetylmuramoyl-L-alanine amidase [Ureibacillus terrenus]TQE91869.1 SH3 domain-containing protein [Ureibacillus terrenus]